MNVYIFNIYRFYNDFESMHTFTERDQAFSYIFTKIITISYVTDK